MRTFQKYYYCIFLKFGFVNVKFNNTFGMSFYGTY